MYLFQDGGEEKVNSVLTLAVQTECMMQMVIEQVLPFLVFLVAKKFDEFGKIGCPEHQGRMGLSLRMQGGFVTYTFNKMTLFVYQGAAVCI